MRTVQRITRDDAIRALREAVAEKGEYYVYISPVDKCIYVESEDDEGLKPSCLVGHALAKLGVPLKDMFNSPQNSEGVDDLVEDLHLDIDRNALACLIEAQIVQDGPVWGEGGSWGAALRASEATGLPR